MAKKDLSQYDDLIKKSAEEAGIDPVKFRAQIMQESSGDASAVSKAGAIGLGQIIPKYWQGKFGLATEADFKDPTKNVPAAAQIMAQHVKQYGGWNEALVVYNAGQGKGNANINAYRRGDIAALPPETQKYLAKLGDNITPLPESTPPGVLGLSGRQADPVNAPVVSGADAQAWAEPPKPGFLDSFKPGVIASTIGTMFRRDDPIKSLLGSGEALSEADRAKIAAANIGPAGAKFVIQNSPKSADIDEVIRLAKENQAAATTQRTVLGGIGYGVGELAGDPLTYGALLVPGGLFAKPAQLFSGSMARAASTGVQLAGEGAAFGLASEFTREAGTGVEADYASALAAGAAGGLGFGAVLGGLGKGYGKAVEAMKRSVNRAEAQQTVEILQQAGHTDAVNPTIFTPMDIDLETGIKWRSNLYPETRVDTTPGLGVPFEGPGGYKPAQIPTLIPLKNGDTLHSPSGVTFSNANPLNPAYAKAVDVNAKAFPTLFEIGDVLAKSKDQSFRDWFANMGRNTRGYVDGSSGKFGATAQDVAKAMDGQNIRYNKAFNDARLKALDDPLFVAQDWTKAERRAVIDQRVNEALYAGKSDGLTPNEKAMFDARQAHYNDLAEIQRAPGARWGVEVPPLLGPATKGTYGGPIVYNEARINQLVDSLPGGHDDLQALVSASFMGSYRSLPEVKAAVDKLAKEQGKTAKELADATAFGIVRGTTGSDGAGTVALSRYLDGAEGALKGEAAFRKMRTPFKHDFEVNVPGDRGTFKVTDLFSHDIDLIDAAYFNRTKGDVSVTVGSGMGLEEFNSFTQAILDKGVKGSGVQAEKKAAENMLKSLYGVGVRAEGAKLAAVESIFKNLAFMKSSAFMGILNYTEIAAGIRQHGLLFGIQAVPGIGKAFTQLRHGKNTAEALHLAQNIVWGMDLDKVIHPTLAQSVDRSVTRMVSETADTLANRALGATQGAIANVTDRFWTTQMLRHTTARITETARSEFFADLARLAHGKGTGNGFANPQRALEASVNEAQFADIIKLLKSSTKVDAKGNLSITNEGALLNDPRAVALRRYGQYHAERVIQQTTPSNSSRLAGLPVIGLFTQFMSFVQKSVNAKLIRGIANIKNGNVGEAMDMFVLAPLLGGMGYAGITYLQSLKYNNEADQEKFRTERMGEDDDWGPLVANAFKRSSAAAGPAWLYDTVGATQMAQNVAPEFFSQAGLGKTSIDARLKRERVTGSGSLADAAGTAVKQAPAIKLASDLVGLASAPLVKATTPEDQFDAERWAKGWQMNMRGLLPNDPLTQRAFMEWIADPE